MHENISGCLCPSKLYGILAAGRPVLAVGSDTTELVQTVQENRVGWCCQPGDSEEIAQSVAAAVSDSQYCEDAGKRARDIACQKYDRPVVMDQFSSLLSELTSASASASVSAVTI